jgi:arginyl-tRNA synthetase
MAEALAGLHNAGWSDPDSVQGRLDRQLGELYARYVTAVAIDEARGNAADRVIARELDLHQDDADRILDRWRAQDPAVRTVWVKLVDRILREQAATLGRLNVAIDDVVLESTALPGQAALVAALTRAGLAQVEPSGAVVMATGRPDYAHCPLVRADGFPTEHLRALVLWIDLAARPYDLTVHVMGDEWRTSTEVRIAVLDQLLATGFGARYAIVNHALVRFGSSTMKSSSGNILLIDDALDAVQARAQSLSQAGRAVDDRGVRAALLLPMLAAAADQMIDVTEATFCRLEDNLGWQLAAVAQQASPGALPLPDPGSPVERFLVLQVERLDAIVRRAASANNPLPVVRFCRHLLALEQQVALTPTAHHWRARLIDHGLTALGIPA